MGAGEADCAGEEQGDSKYLEVLAAVGEDLGGRRDGFGTVAAETH